MTNWTWTWHPVTADPDPFSVFWKPDLVLGKTAAGDVIRVCDFTFIKNYAVIKINDDRPRLVSTEIIRQRGMTPLEYFVDCAQKQKGGRYSQAAAIFDRFWSNSVRFKHISTAFDPNELMPFATIVGMDVFIGYCRTLLDLGYLKDDLVMLYKEFYDNQDLC